MITVQFQKLGRLKYRFRRLSLRETSRSRCAAADRSERLCPPQRVSNTPERSAASERKRMYEPGHRPVTCAAGVDDRIRERR